MQTTIKKVKYLYIAEPVGIKSIKGFAQEEGVIAPESDETIITGWGLLDGFESLRVAYTDTNGEAVDELITDTNSFAQHSDTSIAFPPAFWDKFPAANSDVTFTLTTQKGAANYTAHTV